MNDNYGFCWWYIELVNGITIHLETNINYMMTNMGLVWRFPARHGDAPSSLDGFCERENPGYN